MGLNTSLQRAFLGGTAVRAPFPSSITNNKQPEKKPTPAPQPTTSPPTPEVAAPAPEPPVISPKVEMSLGVHFCANKSGRLSIVRRTTPVEIGWDDGDYADRYRPHITPDS